MPPSDANRKARCFPGRDREAFLRRTGRPVKNRTGNGAGEKQTARRSHRCHRSKCRQTGNRSRRVVSSDPETGPKHVAGGLEQKRRTQSLQTFLTSIKSRYTSSVPTKPFTLN